MTAPKLMLSSPAALLEGAAGGGAAGGRGGVGTGGGGTGERKRVPPCPPASLPELALVLTLAPYLAHHRLLPLGGANTALLCSLLVDLPARRGAA